MTMSADPNDPGDPKAEPSERGALERLIPELLKKVVETGTKNLSSETIRQVLSSLELPREALHYTFSQLDEKKDLVYRAISKEVHDVLERTNLADVLAKALSALSLEVKMEVRFKPTSIEAKTRVNKVKEGDDVRESVPPSSEKKRDRA
jgi:hypothetical protein